MSNTENVTKAIVSIRELMVEIGNKWFVPHCFASSYASTLQSQGIIIRYACKKDFVRDCLLPKTKATGTSEQDKALQEDKHSEFLSSPEWEEIKSILDKKWRFSEMSKIKYIYEIDIEKLQPFLDHVGHGGSVEMVTIFRPISIDTKGKLVAKLIERGVPIDLARKIAHDVSEEQLQQNLLNALEESTNKDEKRKPGRRTKEKLADNKE